MIIFVTLACYSGAKQLWAAGNSFACFFYLEWNLLEGLNEPQCVGFIFMSPHQCARSTIVKTQTHYGRNVFQRETIRLL